MLALIRKSNRPFVLETLATALAAAAALYSACPSAYAKGGGPGNGGDAVKINGKWTLLDLAEAGITRSATYEKNLADFFKYGYQKGFVRHYVGQVFRDPRFTPAMKDGLAATLEWMGAEQGTLIAALGIYSWELVDAPLAQVGDEQSTLDLSKLEMLQLAIRRDTRIQIDSRAFAKLDTLNQVALVIHEIAYALTIPQKASDGTFFQPSWQARSYVARRFQQGALYVPMAEQVYSPGNYIFEATNRIMETMGASNGTAIGAPVLILSQKALENPRVGSRERSGSVVFNVYDVDSFGKKSDCKDCRTVELSTSNRDLRLDSDLISQMTSNCGSTNKNRYHAYVMYRSVTLKWAPVETSLGNTLRPVIADIGTTARETVIDFGSIEQCEERVAAFVTEAIGSLQKQNEISRGQPPRTSEK